MLFNIASPHTPMANTDTARTNSPTPIPLARIAVTSLSAASRLRPMRIPTSTPIGSVIVKVVGRVRKKISATLGRGALLRTISSSKRPRSRIKMMKVNSTSPRTACESTSFRM